MQWMNLKEYINMILPLCYHFTLYVDGHQNRPVSNCSHKPTITANFPISLLLPSLTICSHPAGAGAAD